ncbi:putative triacylglycerol lipase (LipA) [Aspergillus foveolatus]|uniref:putative triacylglycerol lipase (LipA) n=1 Tax=Aspergillus foveolatus TaxID=210207 RepID=UPI003CCDA115
MRHFKSAFPWLAHLAIGIFLPLQSSAYQPNPTPIVTLSNGPKSSTTFIGRSLPEFDQELFLGIKYADKPVRFTPSSLKTVYASNDSDSGPVPHSSVSTRGTVLYNATQYGYDCPGYGSDTTTLLNMGLIEMNEDCLNLNVIRPRRHGNEELLPVLVWIFGGGWQQGATADPRYNMTYVTRQAALNGKPILGVSINYRLAAFGFLDSEEVRASGNNNLGLLDQRVAMRWIKKNIEAFGGDPTKITIWGESAGAYSVGAHLVANSGNNEGLFRAGTYFPINAGEGANNDQVQQSWSPETQSVPPGTAQTGISRYTLQCLREVPFDTLYDVAYEGLEWFAAVDGKFIKEYPQISTTEGRLAKVPILLGSNTDEGVSFGTTGVDTDEDCVAQLISSKRWVLTKEQATELIAYYPDDPIGSPYGWGNVTWPEKGLMYKRYSSMAGDITMAAPRRLLAETMAKYEKPVYSYRWDVAALNTTSTIGVNHFAEIPFVFANPVQNITKLGEDPSRLELANLAARMWASFVTDLDPNGHGIVNIPEWPQYSTSISPSNFVFRLPRNESYVEADDYRVDGIAYLNTIPR